MKGKDAYSMRNADFFAFMSSIQKILAPFGGEFPTVVKRDHISDSDQ
jgi:hypothetical protein